VVYDLTDGGGAKILEISYESAIRNESEDDDEQDLRGAKFIIDSECTHHVVNDLSLLSDVVFASKGKSIGTMKGCLHGTYGKITAWGTIPLLGKVLYAQHIEHNIISVSLLDAAGFTTKISSGNCRMIKSMSKCNIVINGVRSSGNYYADIRVRSLTEGQTIKTMVEDEYDEFELLNESCSMMTEVSNAYYEIVPRELVLFDDIVVDSGSPENMFRRKEDILRLVRFSPGNCILQLANGHSVECLGTGTRGILRLVYWVPSLSKNLLSVQALAKEGCHITFADDYVYIESGSSNLEFSPFLIRKTNLQYILPMRYLRHINEESCNEYDEPRLYVNMVGRPVSGSVRVLLIKFKLSYGTEICIKVKKKTRKIHVNSRLSR